MSREMSDSDDDSWGTDAVQNATDTLREELQEAKRDASGKKEQAIETAQEYLDKAEDSLKKRT